MAGFGQKALPFVAVGRVQDSVILAQHYSCSEETKEQMADIFHKLLSAASMKLVAGQKTRLKWNDGSVVCQMDHGGKLLFCVVTSNVTFPEKPAFDMLQEMEEATLEACSDVDPLGENGLEEKLRPKLAELAEEYEIRGRSVAQARRDSSESFTAAAAGENASAGGPRVGLILCVLLLIVGAIAGAVAGAQYLNSPPGEVQSLTSSNGVNGMSFATMSTGLKDTKVPFVTTSSGMEDTKVPRPSNEAFLRMHAV